MSDSSVNQIEEAFHAVLARPAADRDRYLLESCSGNAALYDEVCSLVAAWEGDCNFLKEPALETALAVLSNSGRESLIGKTIGNYRINSLLGRGGMGEVYLAFDLRLERKVALKFLSRELAGDSTAKSQIISEAQAAAKVDHPNICHIYGLEDFEDDAFIVMQYVHGITLAHLIRKGPVNRQHLFDLIRQIVSALGQSHSQGIIHRDIKPQNIMITPSGQAKLLDFGLATSIATHPKDVETNIKRSSKVRAIPGTIRYMSPEQLRGEDLDSRSDVFSLGTLLYEMVSGSNPFARTSDREVASAILSSVPKPIRQGSARITRFASIVQRCLAKSPKERYKSANEVLLDFELWHKLSRPRMAESHQCSCFAG
jgi:serine/threonine protein kinase